GLWLWEKVIFDKALDEKWFGVDDHFEEDLFESLKSWALAFTGHHGQPRSSVPKLGFLLKDHFTEENQTAALEWCHFIKNFFESLSLAEVNIKEFMEASQQASWLLSGFAILTDWI